MHENYNDPIDVVVDFVENRVRPLSFRWAGSSYTIEKVNLIHSTREGAKKVFFFSVSDQENAFKLRFDPESLKWHIMELYTA